MRETEAYYGGERALPKKNGFALCWFEDDEPEDICWLAHVVPSRGAFCCGNTAMAQCGGLDEEEGDEPLRLAIMVVMEAWIVYYLKHGHHDAVLKLLLARCCQCLPRSSEGPLGLAAGWQRRLPSRSH